ncbi:hypothetical protein [Agromyces bauzanensis]
MTRHTTARATLLLAGALAATLAFAGCNPTEPTPTASPSASATPTPTPTPTEVAAPTSEDEAIEAAEAAMDRYMAVRTEIYLDPSADHDIASVAEGPAAERLTSTATQLRELGGTAEGGLSFEPESGYTAPLTVAGEQIEFGQVVLKGCFDTSELDTFNADGTPAEVADVRRFVAEPVLVYRPSTSSWVVYQLDSPEEIVAC